MCKLQPSRELPASAVPLDGVTRLDLPDLAMISASGAPLDLGLKQETERLFGLTLNNGYGITECSPTIAMTGIGPPRRDDAVGEPIPGVDLRLLGPDRRPVAPGEVGEIHVRTPGLMQGYHRAPDLTAPRLIPKDGSTRETSPGRRTSALDRMSLQPDERPTAMDTPRNASVAVIGAGDFIGAAIARRFAAGGYAVVAGRRTGEKLASLTAEIDAAGGRCEGRTLDARDEASVTAFLAEADRRAPLEVCVFNVGANVNFPILDTTERVFRKVWEMACYAGFLAGREAARLMLAHGRGTIIFTGATASLRGGPGFAAFASAKFGLRAVAQSMARELGPQNIHVAHLVIDSGVDTAWVREIRRKRLGKETFAPDELVDPASIAETYWQLHLQPRDAWTHELDLRPYGETF